ncbi:hypothetical protein D3C76_851150 [compost metagenome]
MSHRSPVTTKTICRIFSCTCHVPDPAVAKRNCLFVAFRQVLACATPPYNGLTRTNEPSSVRHEPHVQRPHRQTACDRQPSVHGPGCLRNQGRFHDHPRGVHHRLRLHDLDHHRLRPGATGGDRTALQLPLPAPTGSRKHDERGPGPNGNPGYAHPAPATAGSHPPAAALSGGAHHSPAPAAR